MSYIRVSALETDLTLISNNRLSSIEGYVTDLCNNRVSASETDLIDISNDRLSSIEGYVNELSNNRVSALDTDLPDEGIIAYHQ